MKRNTDGIKFELRHIFVCMVTSVVLLLFCIPTVWAAGFGLFDNTINIETEGGQTGGYDATVDVDGNVTTLAMQGTNILGISFGIVNDGVPSATYTVNLGAIVDDVNSSRRIEAYLPGVVVVINSGEATVTVPATTMRVVGRNSAGDEIGATDVSNIDPDGPVTATGDTLFFNLQNLVQKIQNQMGSVDPDFADITAAGSYTYSLYFQGPPPTDPTDPSHLCIGYVETDSSVTCFSSVTDIGTSGVTGGLPSSPIANATYLSGYCYIIGGSYSVSAESSFPITVSEGFNLVSFPLIRADKDINTVIGTQLTGNDFPTLADTIHIFNGTSYDPMYLNSSGVWIDSQSGTPMAKDIEPDKGYWIEVKSGHGTQTITVTGNAPTTNQVIALSPGFNLIANPYPTDISLNGGNLGYDTSLGNDFPTLADKIHIFNGTSYDPVYLNGSGVWIDSQSGTATTESFVSGNGVWVETLSTTSWNWTIPVP